MTTRRPPGTMGLPLLGNTVPLVLNPLEFARRRTARYGLVWKTRFFNVPTVALIGAEAQRFVLQERHQNFSWKEGYSVGYDLFGDGLMWLDGPPHDEQRRAMQPAFHGQYLHDYLDRINRIVDEQLNEWGSQGTRHFYEDARRIAFRLASSILLGVDIGQDYRRLVRAWHIFANGPLTLFHWNLPWMRYGRAMAARRRLDAVVRRVCQERRVKPGQDIVSLLVQARDATGQPLSDEQIQMHLRFLYFAAYDTTASTMSWLLLEVLRRSDLVERICAEVHIDEPDGPLTLAELNRQPLLDALIYETLRLHPQVSWVLRGVQEDVDFNGYHIPAGWHIMLIPPLTHRLPDYFADPDRFDPDRFLPSRAEHRAHPYAWIGFGGGPRVCLGEGVAKLEIKALLIHLFRRFDLEWAAGQDVRPQYVPLSRPRTDVVIRYRSRTDAFSSPGVQVMDQTMFLPFSPPSSPSPTEA